MIERIYLLGMMGCGKTTTGKSLAKKIGFSFLDLDEFIENQINISISDYFATYGEDKFRLLERDSLSKTFSLKKTVIGTGGGTPCFFDNILKINQYGISFYLKANEKLLMSRLLEGKSKRPLISNLTDDQLLNYLGELLQLREAFYLQASHSVNAISPLPEILYFVENQQNPNKD